MINSIRPSFGAYLKFKINKKEFGTDKVKERNELYINTKYIQYIEKNPLTNSYEIHTCDHNIKFKSPTKRDIAKEIIEASDNQSNIVDLSDCEL